MKSLHLYTDKRKRMSSASATRTETLVPRAASTHTGHVATTQIDSG